MNSQKTDTKLKWFGKILFFLLIVYWSIALYRVLESSYKLPSIGIPYEDYIFPYTYFFFSQVKSSSSNANIILTNTSGKSDTINVRDYYVSKVKDLSLPFSNHYYLSHNQFFYSVGYLNDYWIKNDKSLSTEDKKLEKYFVSLYRESQPIVDDIKSGKHSKVELELYYTNSPFSQKNRKTTRNISVIGIYTINSLSEIETSE